MGRKDPYHGKRWMPCLYAEYYGQLKGIARKHGYALAVHGTLRKDLDLIAVAWIPKAKGPLQMLWEMTKYIGVNYTKKALIAHSGKKPHGRVAYTIVTGGGGYIDISVIPPKR